MFNLFRSGAKFTKYLLGGLLLIVAASMVTYLIPNTGLTASSDSGVDNVLAEVGGSTITADQVKAAITRLVTNGQLPRDSADVYLPQLIDQMIQDRAAAKNISPEQQVEEYRKRNLLGIGPIPAEAVAEAALFLASDRSRYTTGSVITVDGGLRDAMPR